MKQFVVGIVIGSALTGSLVWAGNLYNKDGSLNAPSGSQAQRLRTTEGEGGGS